jgi:hypothetical protein
MFQTKVVEKIETHILCSKTFFRKLCRLCEKLEKKYCRTRQATENKIIRHRRIASWIKKATDTQSVQYLLPFHSDNNYTNAPHCYDAHTLPVLFSSSSYWLPCLFYQLTQRVIPRCDRKLTIFSTNNPTLIISKINEMNSVLWKYAPLHCVQNILKCHYTQK